MLSRVIMLADLDYFFAQCEEVRNPAIKGKPIVVCVYSGRTENSGAVSTANYIARHLGVRAGIPIIQAKRILKKHIDAIFLPVDHQYYNQVSQSIMDILSNYSDRFEQVSIDEAFLDVSNVTQGDFEQAKKLASKIKDQIYIKEKMTCTIGVAPNKVIAKVASDYQKPDGLTVVKPDEVKTFLSPLSVGKLYGIGKNTEQRLNEMSVKTIGDLASFPLERLIKAFGRKLGTFFHNAANGLNDEVVKEKEGPEQISRIVTLKQNTRNLPVIISELERLSEDVHRHLSQLGLDFRSLGVLVVLEDLSIYTRVKTLETPINDVAEIKKYVKILIERLLSEVNELKVRRVGVKLSSFTKQSGQVTLTEFFTS